MQNNASKPRMLILSDGKPGHFNQSLGIADRLKDIDIEFVKIGYKKKWRDNLIRILTYFLGGIRLSDKFIKSLLKWGLDESSFKALSELARFDLILSTGSSVASPNLLMGKLMNAKTVICTRPSPLGIRHFDLAILPEHSRPHKIGKNILMTFGVPNRVTPENVKKSGIELSEKIGLLKKPVIGVLFGGDDPYYNISADMSTELCDALLGISDAQIAMTTSRRTNSGSEKAIKSRLSNNSSCPFLVIANEGSPPNTVSGILGISNVVIVTEDSFSMVCESASSGKKTIILNVQRKGKGNPKRERVYNMMVKEGYAERAYIFELKDILPRSLSNDNQQKYLDDSQISAKTIREMIYRNH